MDRIERAINAYEPMLTALKGIWDCGMSVNADSVIWEEIRQAIAQAEGK